MIEIGKALTNKQIKTYSKDIYDILKSITISHEERVKLHTNLSNAVKTLQKNTIQNRRIKNTDMNKINDHLDSILSHIQYKRQNQYIAHDGDYYYGLRELGHLYGDLDDYYKPIFAGESFNGNHQWYVCRETKEIDAFLNTYIDNVTPYLKQLIKEIQVNDLKIQFIVGINLFDSIKKIDLLAM